MSLLLSCIYMHKHAGLPITADTGDNLNLIHTVMLKLFTIHLVVTML